jgi:hypothetical protein
MKGRQAMSTKELLSAAAAEITTLAQGGTQTTHTQETAMLMHQSASAHKSPTSYPPDPATLRLQYDHGVGLDMPWTDWTTVLAWMHERHVIGLRVRDRVILTPLHFTQTLWGRA